MATTYSATMTSGYLKISSGIEVYIPLDDIGIFVTLNSLELGGVNTFRAIGAAVTTDVVSFVADTVLYLSSGNVIVLVDVDTTTTAAFSISDWGRLAGSNTVAWPSITDIIYSTTAGDGCFVLGTSPLNYLEFIDVDSAILYSVKQGIVTGLYLGSDNAYDDIDSNLITTSFVTQHADLVLSGEMSYGRYAPSWVAFEVAGELVLCGNNSVRTGMQAINDAFETWVLNGHGFDISMYSNFQFNSYAQLHRAYYAADSTGIYILGGDSDNDTKIHSAVRCGPHHFQLDNRKYIRTMRLGDCGEETQVRIFANQAEGLADKQAEVFIGSVMVHGRDLGFDIQDFEELEMIDIEVVAFQRK